jgi:hypothetical protein
MQFLPDSVDRVLAFVTSMPHPANCASYAGRSELFADSLRSILAQRDSNIQVFAVVNALPEAEMPSDSRVQFIEVGFPPSSSPVGRPSLVGIETDKGAKLGMGTSFAARQGAQHVMYVDSDDYISREISAFVAKDPNANGWYSDSGYFHVRGERAVTVIDQDFHQRNGSTHIIRTDLMAVPEDLGVALERDAVIERIGRSRATQTMGRHRPIVDFFAREGTPLAKLPFPGAIWQIGTGENCTGNLAVAGTKHPLAGAISEEFGLAVPGHLSSIVSQAATLRARVARKVAMRSGSASDSSGT